MRFSPSSSAFTQPQPVSTLTTQSTPLPTLRNLTSSVITTPCFTDPKSIRSSCRSKTIFGGRAIPGAGAIAPDGKRLLVAVPQGGSALKLHLVTDWRSLLDGRASN
jgi:hypothetical protein